MDRNCQQDEMIFQFILVAQYATNTDDGLNAFNYIQTSLKQVAITRN
jgi:hypothetical protein